MKAVIDKELSEIGETSENLAHLNELIGRWAKRRGWYIFINRIPKKGWLVYGLQAGGKQIMQYCGIGIIESYFDSPITSLKKLISQ